MRAGLGANVIDVMKAPFFAKGDGVYDSRERCRRLRLSRKYGENGMDDVLV